MLVSVIGDCNTRSTSTFSNGIDEAVVNHLVRRDLRLESPGLHLLFHSGDDTCIENVAVERKRFAILIVSSASLGGIQPDILSERSNPLVAVLARMLHAALISA